MSFRRWTSRRSTFWLAIWRSLPAKKKWTRSVMLSVSVTRVLLPIKIHRGVTTATTATIVLRPFIWDYPGEPVPEETFIHPPPWSSSNLYQLFPSTVIRSILPVQITCLAMHNFCPRPFWSTCRSGALHLVFHTFLHPISVFFSQHMPIPSQPVLL